MIRVDRSRVAPPASLRALGVAERDRAVLFYGDKANKEKPFNFQAYKAKDVAAGLEQVFRRKCAYCESRFAPVTPADIEHFRPKGAIAVEVAAGKHKRHKPGYYWLAAEWDNLLASCPDCNRARWHEFPDDDPRQVAGKENKFPLINEASRAYAPGEERTLEARQRLLLHPCRDRPELHLEFLPTGVVRGRPHSRKGCKSVEVFGLRRAELNEARRDHLLQLARKMREILREIDYAEERGPNAEGDEPITMLLRELREETFPQAAYAGMARQFIGAFEASMRDGTVRAFTGKLLRETSRKSPASDQPPEP